MNRTIALTHESKLSDELNEVMYLIKVAEEERVRGQEYINFRQGLRVITYLVQFCQKDPGGLSFSMNNVLGYQLMFFIGYIDCKARNRRNRMFGAPSSCNSTWGYCC